MKLLMTILIIFAVLLSLTLHADTPQLINFQGKAYDSNGDPLNGTYSIKFTIYNAPSDGGVAWTETQPSVQISDGIFHVLLGSVTSIEDDVFDNYIRYLGIKIGSDPEMTPRTRIATVPFAYRVATVDGADGGYIDGRLSVGGSNSLPYNNSFAVGDNNTVGATAYVIGVSHTATGTYAAIGGGIGNEVNGDYSVVGGGGSNIADSLYSTVAGGYFNWAYGEKTFIGGGQGNSIDATANHSTIAGGQGNQIFPYSQHSTIGGGKENTTVNDYSSISGGYLNLAGGLQSTVGGGTNNEAKAENSTIGGGKYNSISISSENATIAGGTENDIMDDSPYSLIGGGWDNNIQGSRCFIGGGYQNATGGNFSTIAGGSSNGAIEEYSFVGGGAGNSAGGGYAVIGGGGLNKANNDYSAVGGGYYNYSYGIASTIAGGQQNGAYGDYSSILGGRQNAADSLYSTVAGGYKNKAEGNFAFAAGYKAQALHRGTFVWDCYDSGGDSLVSTAQNQFLVRATNGFGINTNDPTTSFHVLGQNETAFMPANALQSETVVVEDGDAILGLYSRPSGIGGSAISLGEISSGTLQNKWTFVRETASGGSGLRLAFGTDNNPFNNSTYVYFNDNGKVGFGTTSPAERMHVVGNICATGNIASCSDKRFKRDIHQIDNALNRIEKIKGVEFNWRKEAYPDYDFSDKEQIGFIAQDVKEILPEVVSVGSDGYQSIDYGKLTPVLVEAVKQLKSENDDLRARLEKIESILENEDE